MLNLCTFSEIGKRFRETSYSKTLTEIDMTMAIAPDFLDTCDRTLLALWCPRELEERSVSSGFPLKLQKFVGFILL